jgi:hypothetical protein
MKTVSSIVENYIKTKPFFIECFIFRHYQFDVTFPKYHVGVRKWIWQKRSEGCNVSTKRLTEELDFRLNHKINKVIKNIGEITVRSALTDYTFAVSETVLNKQAELISDINAFQIFLHIIKRSKNNIVLSNSVNALVDKHFVNEKLIQKLENLASITVKLPKENIVIPGIYYFIFQRLVGRHHHQRSYFNF